MSLLDNLMAQAGGFDISGLAARAGLNGDRFRTGANAILERITGRGETPEQAAAGAASDTGLSLGSLQALLPALQEMMSKVDIQTLLGNPGQIMGALDRDGDGAVMDDLGDLTKGLFGR